MATSGGLTHSFRAGMRRLALRAFALALVSTLVSCGGSNSVDDASIGALSAPVGERSAPAIGDRSAPMAVDGIAAWLGTYVWVQTEAAAARSHTLTISDATIDQGTARGSLRIADPDVNIELIVEARVAGELIGIVFIDNPGASEVAYVVGDELFQLRGDPNGPTTTLGTLETVGSDLEPSGSYFQRK